MVYDKKVSVILPIYNQEKYLPFSIPAVLNQSYKNLELILVNDGSTDASGEIIGLAAEKDERIVVINKENGGIVTAMLEGIAVATGEYIAFLDPDDNIGRDFISTFMGEIDKDYDFIATGFYNENNGRLEPYFLTENRVYNEIELRTFENRLFFEDKTPISNRFSIARWNKIYKTESLKKMALELAELKEMTLGEDTVFTYLMLKNAKTVKTIAAPNSYFYNISNQSSIMNSREFDRYCKKAKTILRLFSKVLKEDGKTDEQSYYNYAILLRSFYEKKELNSKKDGAKAFCLVNRDKDYRTALKYMGKELPSLKKRLTCKIKLIVPPEIYWFALFAFRAMKKIGKRLQNIFKRGKMFFKGVLKEGFRKSFYNCLHQLKRDNAFGDLKRFMPVLDKRISEIILPFKDKISNLDECPITGKVFVFWWDGFSKAPRIVKKCLESLEKHNPEKEIIQIDRYNYKDYTDISPVLINDFEKGKISIQSFSDILRFNLLYKNGGTWVDATIFFLNELNLEKDLGNKSFDSLQFSTTRDFLSYDGMACSWSIFFMSSRKNGVFAQVMNHIYEKYYLAYKNFPIYFFTDAAIMICKKNKIDDNVLEKVMFAERENMFSLSDLMETPYREDTADFFLRIPQKLCWFYEPKEKKDNFYEVLGFDS